MGRFHAHAVFGLFGLSLSLLFGAAPALADPIRVTALTPTQQVRASTTTGDELGDLMRQLAEADPARRTEAFARLTSLQPDSLEAIEGRLKRLAAKRPPLPRVLTVMTEFRKVQGVGRADAPVDLAAGVLKVLSKRHDAETLDIAEPLLLLRSLEAMGTPRAAELALDVFALEDKAWRWESHRSLRRFGSAMLPALLTQETRHEKIWVRRFCHWGIEELGLRKPGRAVQDQDVAVLAALLRAYGETLRFDAMPILVSYVGDSRILVREAAREALERFGRNAIWQIREAYLNATGKDADASWSHARARRELYSFYDGPKKERIAAALAVSAAALEAGNEDEARRALDEALHKAPTDEALVNAAPAFAKLGRRALDRDALGQAESDYRRALRLDPAHESAAHWRAQLSYIEAELHLAQGIVDLPAYRRSLDLDPEHARAAHVLDVLSGRAREREESVRSIVAWLAAALLALAGLALLRRERDETPDDASA